MPSQDSHPMVFDSIMSNDPGSKLSKINHSNNIPFQSSFAGNSHMNQKNIINTDNMYERLKHSRNVRRKGSGQSSRQKIRTRESSRPRPPWNPWTNFEFIPTDGGKQRTRRRVSQISDKSGSVESRKSRTSNSSRRKDDGAFGLTSVFNGLNLDKGSIYEIGQTMTA